MTFAAVQMGVRAAARMDPRLIVFERDGTITRTTEGSYIRDPNVYASAPIAWAAANGWRREDWRATNKRPVHLIEPEPLQQLVAEPEDASTWSSAGAGTATGGQAAPDGDSDAYRLEDTSDAALYTRRASASLSASTQYAFSIFILKETTGSHIVGFFLIQTGGGSNFGIHVNPRTGAAATAGIGASAVTVEDLGDWWRASFIGTTDAAATSWALAAYPAMGTTLGTQDVAATGAATVWGANATPGPFPQSYIRSATTRGADVLTIPTTLWTRWIDSRTYRWEYYPLAASTELSGTGVLWDDPGAGDYQMVASGVPARILADNVTVLNTTGAWSRYARIVATIDPTAASLVLGGDVSGSDSDPPYMHTITAGDIRIGATATGSLPFPACIQEPIAA